MTTSPALLVVKDRLWPFAVFAFFGLLSTAGLTLPMWSTPIPESKRFLLFVSIFVTSCIAAGSLRWLICGTPRLAVTAQGVMVRGMLLQTFIPWRDIETIDKSSVTAKFITTPVVRLGLRPGARRSFSFWTRLLEHQSGDEYLISLRGTGQNINEVVAALRQLHSRFALPTQTASAS